MKSCILLAQKLIRLLDSSQFELHCEQYQVLEVAKPKVPKGECKTDCMNRWRGLNAMVQTI